MPSAVKIFIGDSLKSYSSYSLQMLDERVVIYKK